MILLDGVSVVNYKSITLQDLRAKNTRIMLTWFLNTYEIIFLLEKDELPEGLFKINCPAVKLIHIFIIMYLMLVY